jgi:hypothetical protein
MTERKLARLQKQKRRLWYADKPNQYGRQYYRLLDDKKKLDNEGIINTRRFCTKIEMLAMVFDEESVFSSRINVSSK